MIFNRYARYYDAIYRRKDYKKECAYLEKLFRRHARGAIKTVLDLGCGTANHMIPLIKKGYVMTGVDSSAPMLSIASKKLKALNLTADLHRNKLKAFRLARKFDAALCLFSVIDYVTQEKDIIPTLENIARHLKRGALFIFDFWNESAVNGHYSPKRANYYKANGNVLERRSATRIFPLKRLSEVRYTCTLSEQGRVIRRDRETHTLRYFAVDEMRALMEQAGFEVADAHPFLHSGGRIRKNTWDVTMVARKR